MIDIFNLSCYISELKTKSNNVFSLLSEQPLTLPCVPGTLRFALFELLKNSIRATCEKYKVRQD